MQANGERAEIAVQSAMSLKWSFSLELLSDGFHSCSNPFVSTLTICSQRIGKLI